MQLELTLRGTTPDYFGINLNYCNLIYFLAAYINLLHYKHFY